MQRPIDWESITVPLDVQGIDVPPHFLRRWLTWEQTETGVLFECEAACGQGVQVRVDVVAEDMIRLRMSPADPSPPRPSSGGLSRAGIRSSSSDLLVQRHQDWPPRPFQVQQQEDLLSLRTARLHLEFPRFPWQMRLYDDARDPGTPFFCQQVADRAYGRFYQVPPPGFDEYPNGRLTARESVTVRPGEAFFGFGEKFTSLNKWGQELVSWAVDSGSVSSYRSYKNVPFFMSTAGYGLFVHSSYPIVFRMGTESSVSYSIHVEDSQLDYFVLYGPRFADILKRYTDLTGRAPVPPKWSFGFWISRAGYRNRREVEEVIGQMRARGFPCDVLSLDPWWMGDCRWCTYEWDIDAFPEPEEMIRDLRAQGVRTCLWITPYVAAGSAAYAEGVAGGYFVRKPDGSVSSVIESFSGGPEYRSGGPEYRSGGPEYRSGGPEYRSGGGLAAVDFTNPEAEAWFQSKLEALLDMGVAVFKSDFGEQAPVDAVYHDGRSGLEMHNLYPLLYNRAVFELTRRYHGRGFTWGRSGYAGSQRYPVQWGGDSYCCLDQMANQLRGLLSYAMSGVPFCSHDVGGFDYPPQAFDCSQQVETWFLEEHRLDPIVYARWLQFGVFSSHIRAHGKQPREPWMYGPEVEAIAHRYLRLRYRLLPYLYSQAVRSSQTGLPMARPMVLEFQSDPTTYPLDLQYMFGDCFLVAPVVNPSGRCQVYLPQGEWVDYWTKEVMPGNRWLDLQVPLDRLPLWVRGGSVVPMGPEMIHTAEKALDPLTLEIYAPQEEGGTVVYDEDRPDVPVHYTREKDRLSVQVGRAIGEVEIAVYGVTVQAASLGAQPLTLVAHPGGQAVRVEGSQGAEVTFQLDDRHDG
jgi:alpha-D-xyloside xylohydrolase